jgi:hypothetical protein
LVQRRHQAQVLDAAPTSTGPYCLVCLGSSVGLICVRLLKIERTRVGLVQEVDHLSAATGLAAADASRTMWA